MNITKHLTDIPDAKSSTFWHAHVKNDYACNQQGFRADSFEEPQELKVVSLGCSNTLGWALDIEDRFSSIFCKNLSQTTGKSVSDWNLGLAGKSNDYIARMAFTCEQHLKPDVYLIAFTGIGRREYWDCNGKCIDYVPSNYPDTVKKKMPNEFHLHKKIHLLSSEVDNINNFFRNFKTIECLLQNTTWFYTFSSGCEPNGTTSQSIENLIPQEKYVDYFHLLDRANDGLHPGKESNKHLADRFLQRYINESVGSTHIERTNKIVRYL